MSTVVESPPTPSSTNRDAYRDVLCLAPMVKAGTLPLRLLALDHGAQLVYTEEMIDFKVLQTHRVVNERIGTVDFVDKNDESFPVFRTCEREKKHVIFQIGTNNAQRALEACKIVENDVFGVDVNMGCPKSFSLSGGMGAALLSQPALIEDILTTLVNGLTVPVTCKIRVLNDLSATVDLCRMIESTGVSAIGVHGRMKHERPRHANRHHYIKHIAEQLSIPVIANGGSSEIAVPTDVEKFRANAGTRAVMIARQALANASVFDGAREKLRCRQEVIVEYLKYCARYEEKFENVKYVVQRILDSEQQTTEIGRRLLASENVLDIYELWNVALPEHTRQSRKRVYEPVDEEYLLFDDAVKMKIHIPMKRLKRHKESAKSTLYDYAFAQKWKQPQYETITRTHSDKRHTSCVTVDGRRFASTTYHTNKKLAEQAAAVVALKTMELMNLLPDEWNE